MEDGGETQRLFYALWPDDALRARLKERLHKVLRVGIGRRVPVENLHITLVFLGQVGPTARGCVEQAAGAVQARPFRLVIDRLGYWPGPRILWAGATHTPGEVFDLVGGLRRGLAACGIPLDERPYQAHMTLARKVGRMPQGITLEPLAWEVAGYSLIESTPADHGVQYREAASWPLAGAGQA